MDKHEQLKNILSSMEDLPEFFKQNQENLARESSRLYYLLYGKDKDYEGPLYNGLQENEWSMITLLISSWVIETTHKIKPKEYNKNIRQLFFDHNVTEYACKILITLINNNIIPISNDDHKQKIISLLGNQKIIQFVNNQVEMILNKIKKCCGCLPPQNKAFVKISNEIGNKCTFINSVKSLKLP